MKRKDIIYSILMLAGLTLNSCMNGKIDSSGFDFEKNEVSSQQGLTIVRLEATAQASYVVAGHPITRYNSSTERFEYNDSVLCLSKADKNQWFGYDPQMLALIEQKTGLTGSSAYVALGNGYYAIDWRWTDMMPLSTISFKAPDERTLKEHIASHCFMTDTKWSKLTDLQQQWNPAQCQPVHVLELWRVTYQKLDQLRADMPRDEAGKDFHRNLYLNGMHAENVVFYDITPAFYDSMQTVYLKAWKTHKKTLSEQKGTNYSGLSIVVFEN